MSEGPQVSKVTLCVKILKWHPVSESLTKVRYRAARAAKNLKDPIVKVTKLETIIGVDVLDIPKGKYIASFA